MGGSVRIAHMFFYNWNLARVYAADVVRIEKWAVSKLTQPIFCDFTKGGYASASGVTLMY